MPGSYGYTGQHADATTGLDYYNARYDDASAGQFASADTAQDGLNRYGCLLVRSTYACGWQSRRAAKVGGTLASAVRHAGVSALVDGDPSRG